LSKARLRQSLSFLKKSFSQDDEALSAIELLEAKGKELSFEAPVSDGSLPLPAELSGMENSFALFSDGACRGNPGPGSFGMLAQNNTGEVIFEGSGVDNPTTNNRMELEGAIVALENLVEYLKENPPSSKPHVWLFSDSKYVVEGVEKWVAGWKARGWKKADKKEPENVDLWKRLDETTKLFTNLKFKWVKGHAGHPQNERCDQLANIALDEAGF
tara:strand:- start:517 stop:1161 length:645 start_codon:yes stop_codon:yes gene_type:complete